MEKKDYLFALIIDAENISNKYYKIIENELNELGNIKIKRIYGDFSSSELNGWKQTIIEEGIIPIQSIHQAKGKNSSDLVMTIDAMDIFYANMVNAFCIATSDSDFSRLAQRLKEGGMYVVVAGENKTPISLANSSNKFILIDEIYKVQLDSSQYDKSQEENKEEIVKPLKLKDIKKAVFDLIENSDSELNNGWVLYSQFVQQLEKRFPGFNHKVYGAKSKRDFFKNKTNCEFYQPSGSTVVYIRMNRSKKES